jgi:molybdenum cofactor cytidylyltransferase
VNTVSFHFGAVILAAGASTRMGQPKQLLRIGGRTLLRRTVDAVLASPAWPVMVVLGAHLETIRPEIARLPVLVVDNRAWAEGLASSIGAGVRALDSFSLSIEAALLVLGDQPHLSTDALARLVATHQCTGRSIVAAHYGGHPGPPALFARRHFPELMALSGPGGARPLFDRHAGSLGMVPMPEFAVDLDTPEDFAASFKRSLETEISPSATRGDPPACR